MHACLSLGFEGVYRATGGAGRAAGHPPRPLRDDPARPAQDDRGSLAALARPDDRAGRQPVPGSGLGGRRGRGRRPARRLSRAAQHAVSGQAEALALTDGAGSSRHGADDRARDRGQAAARSGPARSRPSSSASAPRSPTKSSPARSDADQIGDDDLHPHRQRGAVPLRRRQGQRQLRADRQEDRRRARQGAGRDQRRRLYRHRSDQDPRVPVELRAVGSAREIGRGGAEAGPLPARSGWRCRARAQAIRSRRTTSRRTRRRTGASKSRSRGPIDGTADGRRVDAGVVER